MALLTLSRGEVPFRARPAHRQKFVLSRAFHGGPSQGITVLSALFGCGNDHGRTKIRFHEIMQTIL